MNVHGRVVDYWGEVLEFNGVLMPHCRGIMRDNQAKLVTMAWWNEGRLSVADQFTSNPEEGKYIRIKFEETVPEIPNLEDIQFQEQVNDEVQNQPNDEDADFEQHPEQIINTLHTAVEGDEHDEL